MIWHLIIDDPLDLRAVASKKAVYAMLYGREQLLNEQIDEEGAREVFAAIKASIWSRG